MKVTALILTIMLLCAAGMLAGESLHDSLSVQTDSLFTSPDSLANTIKLLRNYVSASGKTAIVPEEGLFITVIKHRHEMLLFKDLIPLKRYKVAVGKINSDKLAEADKATPEGNFRIVEIEDSSWWMVKKRSKVPSIYGPWFMRLETGKENTFSGNAWLGFGIHGTNEPESIGTYASNGCIRLHNEDLLELKSIVEPVLEHKLVRVLVIP